MQIILKLYTQYAKMQDPHRQNSMQKMTEKIQNKYNFIKILIGKGAHAHATLTEEIHSKKNEKKYCLKKLPHQRSTRCKIDTKKSVKHFKREYCL